MSDTGVISPSTAYDDALANGVGSGIAWSNPTNALVLDGTNTNRSISTGQVTNYLIAEFPFSIPTGATINGIEVVIYKYQSSGYILGSRYYRDNSVKLTLGGIVLGNSKADTTNDWATTVTPTTYGGAADLWGTSPSVANLNGGTFGVAISAARLGATGSTGAPSIDYISMKVYYTSAGLAGVKTYNSLAQASVKTVNGLATSNIKSKNGLT